MASGRRRVDVIRSLVKARSLQLQCAKVLNESLLTPVLMFGCETIIWREKERSRIRTVRMDNLRYLLGIRGPECTDKGQWIDSVKECLK